ncbi:class I glutamine amidotransferase-like protein [Thelephora terrestris]|uniref:glutaminase n=1 Tax=Thelephora terrestris TaxID=56493 RepID=A0A9P6HAE0_9AGAM|nr:class I glutamine amidotransferase-like protein [Thelephora terrestris]
MGKLVENGPKSMVIGILALQGAFVEHQVMLQKLAPSLHVEISVNLVRSIQDLQACDALVIPGGESTTIALLAKHSGLLDPLRDFIKTKPVWGSCAGAILMSRSVTNAKQGGQDLLGGLSVTTVRNGWGSQIESFEAPLVVTSLSQPDRPFQGVFIRAPAVLSIDLAPEDPPLRVIARLPVDLLPNTQSVIQENQGLADHFNPQTVVAFRQGNHLFTSFHPELTKDDRFHDYFVQECVIPSLITNPSSNMLK